MEYSSTNEWPPVSQSCADALIDWLREYALKNVDSQLMDDRRTISPHVILDMGNKGLTRSADWAARISLTAVEQNHTTIRKIWATRIAVFTFKKGL